MSEENLQNLFPYPEMRSVQSDMIREIETCLKNKIHLIAHAPTGLGKTAAALAPALKYAILHNKTVFFLTSRHTQHEIAIETLKHIKKAKGMSVPAVDIIGKQHMCSVPGVTNLYSSDFFEYCKKQREEGKCEFYTNTKKGIKMTTEAKLAMEGLVKQSPLHIEHFKEMCSADDLCSYEIAIALGKKAKVIIADYYYIFSPTISANFFKRTDLDMDDAIVIVDEAHNLPDRVRGLMTSQLSSAIMKRAIKEADKFNQENLVEKLTEINTLLESMSVGMDIGEERAVTKADFFNKIADLQDYEVLIDEMHEVAEVVRETEKTSSISSVGKFLESWKGPDGSYVRFVTKRKGPKGVATVLNYRCLDPSIVTRDMIDKCHAVILMSGTLQPTGMYKDLLGFPDRTMEREYESPFPHENRLNLIIPETTTKYSMRNEDQFKRMAEICAEVTNDIPGNCAIFFPSYYLRDQVFRFFNELSEKTAFAEQPNMTKEEKAEFLEKFKSYKKTGAVLLGVITGSYGEGIDLPGDFLKGVIVVGLPLQKPSLEISSLIEYYDKKFPGKGWDYGYVNPAFQKTLQSAGRCIRSEDDKGIIVFLDERYAWPRYHMKFPKDWRMVVSREYEHKIDEFFN